MDGCVFIAPTTKPAIFKRMPCFCSRPCNTYLCDCHRSGMVCTSECECSLTCENLGCDCQTSKCVDNGCACRSSGFECYAECRCTQCENHPTLPTPVSVDRAGRRSISMSSSFRSTFNSSSRFPKEDALPIEFVTPKSMLTSTLNVSNLSLDNTTKRKEKPSLHPLRRLMIVGVCLVVSVVVIYLLFSWKSKRRW